MTISYTYPGVYIQELPSPVHAITGVATSIAAFVGYTSSGIDNRAQVIFSFADFQRLFGGLASDSELSYAVQLFYLNGGSQAYVVRIPKDGAVAASVTFDDLTFTALSSGAWANGKLLIDVDVQNLNLTAAPAGDPLTFNLTITDLTHQTTEYFPGVTLSPSAMNYVATVVNDPDNGSQLVKVGVTGTPGAAPTVTGIVGEAVTAQAAYAALGGTSGKTGANPAAGTTIASTNLAAGTYSVNWAVQLSGTVLTGDANNFGLYNGSELVATSVNAAEAGSYPQSQESVTIPDARRNAGRQEHQRGYGRSGVCGVLHDPWGGYHQPHRLRPYLQRQLAFPGAIVVARHGDRLPGRLPDSADRERSGHAGAAGGQRGPRGPDARRFGSVLDLPGGHRCLAAG